MYNFDVTIHARPNGTLASKRVVLDGCERTVIDVKPGELVLPLTVTFEEADAALQELPGLFFEPDGSFVWGEGADSDRWQVDGLLHDQGRSLMTVQLRGRCPAANFTTLLLIFRPRDSRVVIQLNRFGIFIEESQLSDFLA